MNKIDLLLAGVGGQGIILASDILGEIAMDFGYDVKKSDVLGMAQRGGSVVSHVRLGEKIRAPLIAKGEVDFLLAFEKLEAARWAEYLGPESWVIINDQCTPPLSVSSGYEVYPSDEQIRDLLQSRTSKVYFIDALSLAEELGRRNVLNVLMLGFLSHLLPIDSDSWIRGVSELVPSKFLKLNIEAFHKGESQAERMVAKAVDKSG